MWLEPGLPSMGVNSASYQVPNHLNQLKVGWVFGFQVHLRELRAL